MKVWVVERSWDYEGSQIVGVYDSQEKAEAAKAAEVFDYTGPDHVDISEFDVK